MQNCEYEMSQSDFINLCREINQFRGNRVPMLAMEESGELIQAISKMERNEKNPDILLQGLVDEIGDLYIILEMLELYYSIPRAMIQKRIYEKSHKKCELPSEQNKGW